MVNRQVAGPDVPQFWLGQKFLGNHSNVPGGTFWNNGPTVVIFFDIRRVFSPLVH